VSGSSERTKRNLEALEGDLASGRLHHALLFQGKNLLALEKGAIHLARKILGESEEIKEHPDLFHLRPSGKARLITVESTRGLISNLNRSASQGTNKVALIHEVDRMRREAANAFLKTLEEPPQGTFILMLTTRPYSLLPTIRSRCLQVRLEATFEELEDEEWKSWLNSYKAWIQLASDREAVRRDIAAPVFIANGLILSFRSIIARKADEVWAHRKQSLPEGIDEKERDALETGVRKGTRATLLAALEERTRDFAISLAAERGQELPGRKLAQVIESLEKAAGLLEVNLKEETALEYFWLSSLRTWTAK
tara:strand:- start:1407 stop:2336 length:930 start_codon:yes stop_codon:yes gene_type:complete